MAVKKLTSVVTGVLFDVKYGLEGKEIALSYDGDQTYQSTDNVSVEGELGVFLKVVGILGSAWTLQILCEGQAKPFYSKEGVLDAKGYVYLVDAVECPC